MPEEIKMTVTESTVLSPAAYNVEAFKERLGKMLSANQCKPGSAKARTIEYGYINGLIAVYGETPYFTILLISGRSLLDS